MRILAAYCVSPSTLARRAEARAQQDPAVLAGVDVWDDFAREDGPLYSLAKARNRCRLRAITGGYDLMLALDADAIVESLPAEWTDFGIALVRDYAGNPDYQPAAWWGIGRDVFTRHAWCEGYRGHGWEERDFAEVVCHRVSKAILSDFRCRHLPHPPATPNDGNAGLFRHRLSHL